MSLGSAFATAFVRLRVDSSQIAADTSEGIEEGAGAADVETAGANAGERYSSGFNKAFKAAMIGALVIAAIGAASVKAGVDFQDAMTKIQTQAGASSQQVKQLSAEVLNLAPSTEQGPMQLAQALYHLKSVGLSNAQAMSALKTASDLAAVGGSNLEQTTNALAAAWRSGITGAQNFGTAAATLNAIVGAGNMTMSQLVSAMGTGILSSAKTFGVSLTQVGGAMALLTDSGVPAQQAASRLRMTLSLMGSPSATAAAQLKTIGLSSTALATAMRSPGGLVSAIALLKQHLQDSGLTAVQTAALLSRAFGGGDSSSAIMTMINNLDALRNKQTQINAGMSKFGADVAAQRKTAAAQVDLLKSAVETAGVRIGLALLPPLVRFVHILAADVIPDVLKFGGMLGTFAKNPFGGAFLAGLVAALVTIKAIITAMKIWDGLKALFGEEGLVAALGPIGIAVVAVVALAAAIVVLYKRSKAFRDIVHDAFHGMLVAVKAVYDWITSHWELLAAILVAPFLPAVAIIGGAFLLVKKYWSDIWRDLAAPVVRAFDAVKNAITGGFDGWWASNGKQLEEVWHDVWDAIMAVAGPVLDLIEADWKLTMAVLKAALTALEVGWKIEWTLMSTVFKIAWGALSAVVRGVWDEITGVTKAAWAVISGVVKIGVAGVESVIKIAWDLIVGIFDVALDLLTGKWGKAWDQIKTTVTQVVNAIEQFLGTAWSDVEHTAEAAWNALSGGVKSLVKNLLGYFKALPGEILGALGNVGKLLWNAGISIIKGLLGGIKSAIGGIGHVMGDVASAVKSFLPFSPAKQGPLSGKGDPYYSGLSIGKKIASGITASLPALKAAVSGSVSTINSALSKAAPEEASGTKSLASLTASKDDLDKLRTSEEQLIKALETKRKDESDSDKTLKKAQEDEIQSLEKLRKTQQTQIDQNESVSKTLRAEMSKLKDQVDKLKDALTKATKAAATAAASSSSSSSDDDSSDDDSSDDSTTDSTPDWSALSGWLAETSGQSGNPANGGSWQGNPGPMGPFGLGFRSGMGPQPLGYFDGSPPGLGGGHGDPMTTAVVDRLDTVVATLRALPGKQAAGTAAAMNGVSRTAIMRGNW